MGFPTLPNLKLPLVNSLAFFASTRVGRTRNTVARVANPLAFRMPKNWWLPLNEATGLPTARTLRTLKNPRADAVGDYPSYVHKCGMTDPVDADDATEVGA